MSKYNLEDYNALAYEFAIRNPRVLELIKKPLTDEIVKELSTFGLKATTVEVDPEDGSMTQVNSLKDLYLEYRHINKESIPCNSGDFSADGVEIFIPHDKSHRKLYYPKKSFSNFKRTSIIDEFERIDGLIESRGGRLRRLMNGKYFEHYDAVVIFGESVYSQDPSTNDKPTINTDIDFIKEWIEPSKYLQLLPHNHRYTSKSF